MKKFLCCLATLGCLSLASSSSFAAELFPDKKPAPYTAGSELPAGSTMGGYAIYQGDENWQLVELTKRQTGALGDAEPLSLGVMHLQQLTSLGEWSAQLYVVTSLSSAGPNQYMTGNPCAGDHLVAVNKAHGLDDNCLTIDARTTNTGPNPSTMLLMQISHAKSSGRLYRMTMYINLEPTGFATTVAPDWTPAAVKAVPERAAFVQRLQKWAESLQDGSERALEFKKPQDVFAGIPSYRTLMPPVVAAGLPADFLKALAVTRNAPGFKAVAYTQIGERQYRWQTRTGMDEQATANEQALESCESARPKAAAPCKLYDLTAADPAPAQ